MAKKRINQLPELGRDPQAGDKVHLWDGELERSVQVDVEDLPGTGGGGGTTPIITSVASPFFISKTHPSYSYDIPTNTISIIDARLLNKTQYPVATTQFGGGVIKRSLITYTPIDPIDDTKGKVEISGFELDDDSDIVITLPGEREASGDVVYTQLLADVAILKVLNAPFKPTILGPGLGKVWWPSEAGDIPAGWQICVAMQGYLPMAQDPADTYDPVTNPEGMDRAIGTTGGAKMHTNTIDEMAPHDHGITIPSRDLDNYADSGGDLTVNGAGDTRILTTKKAGGVDDGSGTMVAKPYSVMNQYLIGHWIECATTTI